MVPFQQPLPLNESARAIKMEQDTGLLVFRLGRFPVFRAAVTHFLLHVPRLPGY